MKTDTLFDPEAYFRALRFAAIAHMGQKWPGSEMPYLVHPVEVAMEVIFALSQQSGCNGNLAVSCGLLHDVLEDTKIPIEQLRSEFGEEIADGVLALSKNAALPKAGKLPDSLERIRKQPREVWMVKLADRIANLRPPPAHWSRGKIQEYREEAEQIFTSLQDASKWLSSRLRIRIDEYASFTH